MSNDGSALDPRACLPAAIAAVAAADDLDGSLEALLEARRRRSHPAMAAIFISDPDRAGLQLVASHGMDDEAAGAAWRSRSRIRATRSPRPAARSDGDLRSRGRAADGGTSSAPTCRWSSSSGGVERRARLDRDGLAGAAELDDAERA